jgi:hypothetical protein
MSTAAPSLLEMQRSLLASLAGGQDDAAASQILADGIEPAGRLAIYRNTSISTLVGALRLAYPAVRKLVGEEFFEGAARLFIGQQRATSAWLDEYGRDFGAFLAAFPPAAGLPYLPAVAELEWCVGRALHAPEAGALDLARLAAVPAADSVRLRLIAHPALSLLRADSPVDSIWHAVLDDDAVALGSIDVKGGPVFLLIERRDSSVRIQRLSESTWRFAKALSDGATLSEAMRDNPDCGADALLGEHLAAGRFVDFELQGLENL